MAWSAPPRKPQLFDEADEALRSAESGASE
jgi:hypothetical protein